MSNLGRAQRKVSPPPSVPYGQQKDRPSYERENIKSAATTAVSRVPENKGNGNGNGNGNGQIVFVNLEPLPSYASNVSGLNVRHKMFELSLAGTSVFNWPPSDPAQPGIDYQDSTLDEADPVTQWNVVRDALAKTRAQTYKRMRDLTDIATEKTLFDIWVSYSTAYHNLEVVTKGSTVVSEDQILALYANAGLILQYYYEATYTTVDRDTFAKAARHVLSFVREVTVYHQMVLYRLKPPIPSSTESSPTDDARFKRWLHFMVVLAQALQTTCSTNYIYTEQEFLDSDNGMLPKSLKVALRRYATREALATVEDAREYLRINIAMMRAVTRKVFGPDFYIHSTDQLYACLGQFITTQHEVARNVYRNKVLVN